MDHETPKTFKTTRELLQLAENLHTRLKGHWEKAQRVVAEPEADMFIAYIRRKEKQFISMVSRYIRQAPDDILETYFQFAPRELQDIDALSTWRPAHGEKLETILAEALKIDSQMQSFYRRAAELAASESVRDMFTNLADAVEDKKKSQVQNAEWVTDI